jgi:hypothetical protein
VLQPCRAPRALDSPPPSSPAQELEYSPYVSLWLRYTSFIPLYPLGVSSELAMVYLALPTIRATSMWSVRLPNRFNFGFDYHLVCILGMLTYLPGAPCPLPPRMAARSAECTRCPARAAVQLTLCRVQPQGSPLTARPKFVAVAMSA